MQTVDTDTTQFKLFKLADTGDELMSTLKFLAGLDYVNAADVVAAVRDALIPKPKRISLDLAAVPLLDSSGLRALLQAKKLCEEADARFEIQAISDAAARVIAMSGLSDCFGMPHLPPTGRISKTPEGMSDGPWNVQEFVAISDASVISDLREKATTAAREAGATDDVLLDIQISVGEALTNAYRHGSPDKGTNKITLRCLTCPKAVVLEILDEGHKFDYENCREPDPNEMRDHGMGIYLMRQAMDVVDFCCGCPGNRVRMIKWLE